MSNKFLSLEGFSEAWTRIKARLSAVAFSGSYTDLSDKPKKVHVGSSPPSVSDVEIWIDTTDDVNGEGALTKNAADTYYANLAHTHDDRYYTESEVDTLLSNKAATSHNHDSLYYTESEIDNKLLLKQSILSFDTSPADGSTNPVTSGGVKTAIDNVVAVAQGKTKCFVFDIVSVDDYDTFDSTKTYCAGAIVKKLDDNTNTYKAYACSDDIDVASEWDSSDWVEISSGNILDVWLQNSSNTASLNSGDVFLVRALNVPDYWWDGEKAVKQKLETTKIDLSGYYTKGEADTLLNGKASSDHLHDDRYYTETEVNNLLSGKANIANLPSSLPANGGNADTVDGFHIVEVNGMDNLPAVRNANTIYLVVEGS